MLISSIAGLGYREICSLLISLTLRRFPLKKLSEETDPNSVGRRVQVAVFTLLLLLLLNADEDSEHGGGGCKEGVGGAHQDAMVQPPLKWYSSGA